MTGKIDTERLCADEAGIARAVEILVGGGLVAVPTETVYGLAVRADQAEAVARIYEAKGRPSFNPLIVHVADAASAGRLAQMDDRAEKLAGQYWPGPLTMVVPLLDNAEIAPAVTGGLATIGLRVPAHPVMQAVLTKAGLPLAAPSANRSETISPTSADHVLATLDGRIDAVIDAGQCERGLESTIVALRDLGRWNMLRPGPNAHADLETLLGPEAVVGDMGIEAPGQLARHYAPGKPMRLDASEASEGEFLIGFGAVAGDVSLSVSGDLVEAASRLYSCLHGAALSPATRIAVAPVPNMGVGLAINDRLRRAATP